ncbi:hypothetical protein TRICI_006591 [Trichomonascus ciferrii]|uniref:Uncharacterized protein n=1 Tax=Trichomonascus ciferrii TaxID=44093 RepID=A0A642UG35_9ASCO|nr:hypothetical protein TRICI_006591 [Trichomonascus ciferrii]
MLKRSNRDKTYQALIITEQGEAHDGGEGDELAERPTLEAGGVSTGPFKSHFIDVELESPRWRSGVIYITTRSHELSLVQNNEVIAV